MTELAEAVERQLNELLSEAEPAWLDREPEVREEVSFVGFEQDSYAHQHYWYSSQRWEEEAQRRYKEVFGPKEDQRGSSNMFDLFQQLMSNEEMTDGPTP